MHRACLPIAAAAFLLGSQAAFPQSLDAQIARATAAAQAHAATEPRRAEGWRPFGGDVPLMGRHWTPPDAPVYVTGDAIDPARPSNYMFTSIEGKKALVALAYIVRIAPSDPLPRGFAGDADVWHVHDMSALIEAIAEERPAIGRAARRWLDDRPAGGDGRTRLAMVHLWLIPNPEGRFATHNPALAYLDLGLPAEWADGMNAARGLALAGPDGCSRTLDGQLWLSGAVRATRQGLHRTCEALAGAVRNAIPEGKDRLNAVARGAWRRMTEDISARLTADEKRRVATIVEHAGPALAGHDMH